MNSKTYNYQVINDWKFIEKDLILTNILLKKLLKA